MQVRGSPGAARKAGRERQGLLLVVVLFNSWPKPMQIMIGIPALTPLNPWVPFHGRPRAAIFAFSVTSTK